MSGSLQLKTGLKNRRGISTHLKQALKVLTMNHVELETYIKEKLESNPFLEESDQHPKPVNQPLLMNGIPLQQPNQETFESYTQSSLTIQDYLLNQLNEIQTGPKERRLIEIIISSIGENGFTDTDHQVISEKNGYSHVTLQRALKIIQALEPTGIAAKDLWQSLEWQAKLKYPQNNTLLDIIICLSTLFDNIPEINDTVMEQIGNHLHLPISKLQKDIKKISTLNPHPAANYGNMQNRYVFPDIIYSEENNKIKVQITNYLIPDLLINEDLVNLINSGKADKKWISFYKEANHVLQSINYRKDSLLKVALIIQNKQHTFFKKGLQHIAPMSLSDIAGIADIHISTVSRIVSRKYCQTPFGIYPLSIFLKRKLKSAPGCNYGVDDLKKAISQVVQQEDKAAPYSDEQLEQKLQELGIIVKRRTIAKYRKLLHIPTQNKRRAK